MTVTEKVAYLKGLAEGLDLDANKKEVKVINALMDVVDELALTVSDLEDELSLVSAQVDEIDEDLGEVEEIVYDEDFDDDECGCGCDCCDDDLFEVKCPSCGETIYVDESILEEGDIDCPNCGENLEFEIDFDDDDCDCCDDDE
ncbi:MAG: zinc ribbon domain-containing protein [Clostridiales bacterium]|nr:zinc ribbon domain-containing protein [Clostridiales bacterium]